jgi:seryl-tRNA synthetase
MAQFMLDLHTREHGYTECYTPYIVNREILEGTGQLPKFKDDMFWVLRGGDESGEAQYLISTSEISLTNSVRGQILDAAALPIKLTAHSLLSLRGGAPALPRGMIRQHQFDRVEMVRIVAPETTTLSADDRRAGAIRAARAVRVVALHRDPASARPNLRPRGSAGQGPTDRSCSNCEAFRARRRGPTDQQGRTTRATPSTARPRGRAHVVAVPEFSAADAWHRHPAALRPTRGQGDRALRVG